MEWEEFDGYTGSWAIERSDELADMRQENVLFAVAVAQDGTLFAKSIQEGRSPFASKVYGLDAVPDSKIWKKCHREISHPIDVREKGAYSSSGNGGKIIVKVVIGGRHCSCALSEDGDPS